MLENARSRSRNWQSEVFDSSTGHPLGINVIESSGLSLVEIHDPTLDSVDGHPSVPHQVVISGPPLCERDSKGAKEFFQEVRSGANEARRYDKGTYPR